MAERPFAPGLAAAPKSAKAATYTPFHADLTRPQGQQELKGIDVTLPPGATAKLKGIPYCPPAAIAAAAGRAGAAEQQSPSCPADEPSRRRLDPRRHRPGAAADRRQGLPRRPLQGRAALAGRHHPGARRSLRPRHRRRPRRRSTSTRKPRRSAPSPTRSPTSSAAPSSTSARSPSTSTASDFTLNGTNCDTLATTGTLAGGGADPTNPAAFSSVRGLGPVPRQRLRPARVQAAAEAAALRRHPPHPAPAAAGGADRATRSRPTSPAPRSPCRTRSSSTSRASARSAPGRSSPPNSARRDSIYGHARAFSPLLDKPLEGPGRACAPTRRTRCRTWSPTCAAR